MRTRRTARAGVGILTAAAVLLLTGLPAAANTVRWEVTTGTVALYEPLSVDPFLILDLAEATATECESATHPLEGTYFLGTTNLISGYLFTAGVTTIAGDDFQVNTVLTFLGSWVAGTPETVSGDIYIYMDLSPVSGPSDCTPDDGACEMTLATITVEGIFDGTLPTAAVGDSMTVFGSNEDFEVLFTGDLESCGPLLALEDGHADLTAEFTVTEVTGP